MKNNNHNKFLTVPNMLTVFRILLIPIFIWLYTFEEQFLWAGIILLLSGVSDFLDGFIARRFNLITDAGKMLDPMADKLTQVAILFSLIKRFPLMIMPFIFLIVKEFISFILSALVVTKTGEVQGAKWHGKISTALIYLMMGTHVIWFNIPSVISNIFIIVVLALMSNSLVLYLVQHITTLLFINKKDKNSETQKEEHIEKHNE